MFVKNFTVLFMFTFVVFCKQSFVDELPKCHLNDNECLRSLYQTAIHETGQTGVPELKIPPVDPIILKDFNVNIPDVLNSTLTDGEVKGLKDCIFEKFSLNIKEERGHQEITCNLIVKGHYIVDSNSPVFRNLLGGAIHGEGKGKLKIGKLHLKFDFPFYVQKRNDGEIYIKCLYDSIRYDYTIGGPVSFAADNLYLGNKEMSKSIINILNDNSQLVLTAFGKPFIDKALREIYFKYVGNFFDFVPAKYYIIDDLSLYAKP